eukprot:2153542-Lingulodinium_polyedra.AAC.1
MCCTTPRCASKARHVASDKPAQFLAASTESMSASSVADARSGGGTAAMGSRCGEARRAPHR